MRIILVHGAPLGVGGLGVQSANAVASLSGAGELVRLGPNAARGLLFDRSPLAKPLAPPELVKPWMLRYTHLRWAHGAAQQYTDIGIGKWAAAHLDALRPDLCYAFTQVGLETLKWARRNGKPSVLESPNGHIRNFRNVYDRESEKWCSGRYHGHPTWDMVARVEKEYEVADTIRVSSEWAKASLVAGGVPAEKIVVFEQSIDLATFHPGPVWNSSFPGPLKTCYVGSLDLRKGFVYLLRAIRMIGADKACLNIAGATGDSCSARLFSRERQGLDVKQRVGDPVPVYHGAEILAFPTLEDGSPFAVAEAMSCGLPVIVTDQCGSADWVTDGVNGWIVKAADSASLAEKLDEAIRRRTELSIMGREARKASELRVNSEAKSRFLNWIQQKAPRA